VITEIVPSALAGQRLDRIVALAGDMSRSDASIVIAAGGVTVDGEVASSGKVRLTEGQSVTVDLEFIPKVELPVGDDQIEFRVVHEDSEVIVVDKPAGLVVHPGAGNPVGTLANGLLARYPEIAGVGDPMRPGIVHRLDAGSSGLLVVARTPDAAEHLISQFIAHSATRRYIALVWGHPAAPHGIVDAPIGRDRRDPLRMAVVADGKRARTEYEVRETFTTPTDLALLGCQLETGRTHQIRVHLASIGHPLVGDTAYGERRPLLGLTRPFLHAEELAFEHPSSGETMRFGSALPADLVEMLGELEA
jgi:23S rRNA pseudouridine1911/1915/1917 synthase